MVCRGFMLRLEEAGYIKLPPGKRRPTNPLAHRTKPPKIDIEQIPLMEKLKTWLNKQLDGIQGVRICQDGCTMSPKARRSEKLLNKYLIGGLTW